MTEERQPIEQVLPGQTLHPLDEGEVPLFTFALIKCLDRDGDVTWSFRTSESANLEELLGAMTVQVDLLRRRLTAEWGDE
ncbi:hypothetical protein [Angustibacter luteus]|uniref:Uncharacterized protein n=1 Tax=Angustibacter luteus TaxID=658456 RepID=A0ABW1JCQ9_9ACTN